MTTKTKLNWNNFSPKVGSWARVLKEGFEEGLLDEVFPYLKKRNKESGVYPSSENLWNPFQLCPYGELKLVIACAGELNKRSDGLALSGSNNIEPYRIEEPLDSFLRAIEKELYDGLCLSCIFQNDLSYLAKQGVLLLNIPMTGDKEEKHTELWNPFTEYLLREAISYTGVPVLFLGEETFRYEDFLCPWQERFKLPYPGRDWSSEGVFKKIEAILRGNNGDELKWMKILPC